MSVDGGGSWEGILAEHGCFALVNTHLDIPVTLIFQASYYGRANPTYWVANNEVSETGEEATNLILCKGAGARL